MNDYYPYSGQPNYGYPQQQPQNTFAPTNCYFIDVTGPEQVKEQTVRPGQTLYFRDNNRPFLYSKSADSFGMTTNKAFRLEEIDFDSFFQPVAPPAPTSSIDPEMFNQLCNTVSGLCEGLKNLEAKFDNQIVTKTNNHNNNQRRDKNEPTGKSNK